jgi:hypothetical protein
VTANPVLFSLGRGRNGATAVGSALSQPATSTNYVQVEVFATLDGAPYNPTSDATAIAFVPQPAYGSPPDPTDEQWNTAGWETDPGPAWWSSILTGPTGVVLAAGAYVIAVQVTDNPAAPVMWGPVLVIS